MKIRRFATFALAATLFLSWPSASRAETPGCQGLNVHQCLELAFTAMGGRERLAGIRVVRTDAISHTALMEQSYRQSPFITSYQRDKVTRDFAEKRLLVAQHSVWPESDPHQAESDATLVVTPEGGGDRDPSGDSPCSLADLDSARDGFALGPERLLLTAADATDLHFEESEILRSTPHVVLGFTWNKISVRVVLNSFNHLPDAVETTQGFNDFWYFWGDVSQRVYFDNWQVFHGLIYPTNQVIERNGSIWRSTQVLDLEINPTLEQKTFAIDPTAVQKSAKQKGWNRTFRADNPVSLAPGIDLYAGAWNTTIIKQADGVLILETPISSTYTEGIFKVAAQRYPGVPVKAALSTSDSWPHVGGVREDVARGTPVYILDLNQPLLDRMLAAPHRLNPDALQRSPRPAQWRVVTAKTVIGDGPNRMELYPVRGASTERQYMVYFPERKLLYASDTLSINEDKTLYDPELMREVIQAVRREGIEVITVFAMHQRPTPWDQVVSLVEKSLS